MEKINLNMYVKEETQINFIVDGYSSVMIWVVILLLEWPVLFFLHRYFV